jgi:hypothetical protein
MVGQGTGQWRILEKLLKGAPLAIMAEQLPTIGAEGQQRRELTLLIMKLAAATLLSGDKNREEDEEQGENKDRPGTAQGWGQGLVNGAPGENGQGADGVGGEGADVVDQEPDGQKKEEKGEIGCKGTGQGTGQGEAGEDGEDGEDGRERAPAAEVLA